MTVAQEHAERIKQELRAVGVTPFGARKFASRYLPNTIHDNEHIGGAVYGRFREGGGLLNMSEGMLVATDHRVIFLDHKPGYTNMDELTYDVVSGVRATTTGPFTAVTLRTKVGDFTIRFANAKCVETFVHYIETRRLERTSYAVPEAPKAAISLTRRIDDSALDDKAATFLAAHDTGVLSTIDRTGNVHGAVVHYFFENNLIYILTKADTQKAHNVFAHHQVALTVYDEAAIQTVQLQGSGEIEPDQNTKDRVFAQIVRPHSYGDEQHLPPVTALHNGAFMVIRVTPTLARFIDFKH